MRRVVIRFATILLALGSAVAFAALAWADTAVEVHERFTPDRLGAPTNLSLTARLGTPGGAPAQPVRKLTVFAPAGLTIDARGAGTCNRTALERSGPSACPTNSRAGFGGGVGVLQLPREAVHANFTLDFFFESTRPGHISLLVYAASSAPVEVELVVVAHQVRAAAPYGLGFTVEVPPVSPIPGAPPASIESVFATLGAAGVAYYERIHGHRRLVHVRGLLVPRSCPRGGFPARATIEFLDGQSTTLDPNVPCPAR